MGLIVSTLTISILSTDHLEQRVAAVAVGLLVVLHQAVQRAELQALVHQRAAPGQTQGTELSLTHFIEVFRPVVTLLFQICHLVSNAEHYVIVELPPLEQRDFVDLRLEVDGEPAEAGDAVGQVDGQHHRLHALDR